MFSGINKLGNWRTCAEFQDYLPTVGEGTPLVSFTPFKNFSTSTYSCACRKDSLSCGQHRMTKKCHGLIFQAKACPLEVPYLLPERQPQLSQNPNCITKLTDTNLFFFWLNVEVLLDIDAITETISPRVIFKRFPLYFEKFKKEMSSLTQNQTHNYQYAFN